MKSYMLMLLPCCLLFIGLQAVPVTKARGMTSHDRELFREILCILKDKTAAECLQDRTLGGAMQRLQVDDDGDTESGRPVLDVDDLKTHLPMPPSNKRDAFYSDWRRRR